MDRRTQLKNMTVLGGLSDLARGYGLEIDHMKKSEIIEAIINHEAKSNPQVKAKRPPRNEAKTKIKALRVKHGISQTKLADIVGMSPRSLQHYEQGSRSFDGADISTILKVALALKEPLENLMEDKGIVKLVNDYMDMVCEE